ncbi:hypothetical protein BTM25_23530 [Actinomadura rubteroloni]|uniref:Uncharacterized protein n=1 Tax=Actinomadura rubteroloni TaxID=1926885 RepID=A0A2P4UFD7_9ACTN|nr:hypothetical protein BTM25_23530 [Actinomadura rubteroloni]
MRAGWDRTQRCADVGEHASAELRFTDEGTRMRAPWDRTQRRVRTAEVARMSPR